VHKTTEQKQEIKLVGISARTSNQAEMNPATAKIGQTMQRYFTEVLPHIGQLADCATTFCVYTEYESDYTGPYTYFIGAQVSAGKVVDGAETLTIPAQSYAKFTTALGAMPAVVIDAWMKIWQMTPADFGGNRGYKADFEVYDSRALDPMKSVVDIYIGLQ